MKAVQELTGIVESQQKEIVELKEQLTLNKNNSPTSLEEGGSRGAVLFQNSPNPFSANTQIKFSLPETVGRATVIIYNMERKQLKVVPIPDRGDTGVEIQAQELKVGMYIYSLIADGTVIDTKRMILTGIKNRP